MAESNLKVNVDADTSRMLGGIAAAMRVVADMMRNLSSEFEAHARRLEAKAIGWHRFVFDSEAGDCGECALDAEHPVHDTTCPACGHDEIDHARLGTRIVAPVMSCDQDGSCDCQWWTWSWQDVLDGTAHHSGTDLREDQP